MRTAVVQETQLPYRPEEREGSLGMEPRLAELPSWTEFLSTWLTKRYRLTRLVESIFVLVVTLVQLYEISLTAPQAAITLESDVKALTTRGFRTGARCQWISNAYYYYYTISTYYEAENSSQFFWLAEWYVQALSSATV